MGHSCDLVSSYQLLRGWVKQGKGCRTCGAKCGQGGGAGGGGGRLLVYFIFPFFLASSARALSLSHSLRLFLYQGGDEGRTWDRKDMLSTGRMAMLSGPAIFMGMGVVIATGWAIFIGAEAGMLTEAMLTGPVMVTGCWRLTGDVMLTVLVLMFICAAMVTGWLLLLLLPRFIAVVMGAETVTGVAEAELQTSLLSEGGKKRGKRSMFCPGSNQNWGGAGVRGIPLLQELKLVWPWVFRWLVM